MGERRGTKALETWCRRMTDGYRGVKVENMTTSWRNGMAFCAMIHHFRPDLIDFDSLNPSDVYDNNALAFGIAERHLGIPALLDAEDMAEYAVPDRLSILTYLSQYYQKFAGASSPESATPRLMSTKRGPPSTDRGLLSPTSSSPPSKMSIGGTAVVGLSRREPCAKCGMPVFLAERLNVGKSLYHRTCFQCARCGAQLSPGNCYETETPGQYCCETCPDEDKLDYFGERLSELTNNDDGVRNKMAIFEGKSGTYSSVKKVVGKETVTRSLSDEEKYNLSKAVDEADHYKSALHEFSSKNKNSPMSSFISELTDSMDNDHYKTAVEDMSLQSKSKNSSDMNLSSSIKESTDDLDSPPRLPNSPPPISDSRTPEMCLYNSSIVKSPMGSHSESLFSVKSDCGKPKILPRTNFDVSVPPDKERPSPEHSNISSPASAVVPTVQDLNISVNVNNVDLIKETNVERIEDIRSKHQLYSASVDSKEAKIITKDKGDEISSNSIVKNRMKMFETGSGSQNDQILGRTRDQNKKEQNISDEEVPFVNKLDDKDEEILIPKTIDVLDGISELEDNIINDDMRVNKHTLVLQQSEDLLTKIDFIDANVENAAIIIAEKDDAERDAKESSPDLLNNIDFEQEDRELSSSKLEYEKEDLLNKIDFLVEDIVTSDTKNIETETTLNSKQEDHIRTLDARKQLGNTTRDEIISQLSEKIDIEITGQEDPVLYPASEENATNVADCPPVLPESPLPPEKSEEEVNSNNIDDDVIEAVVDNTLYSLDYPEDLNPFEEYEEEKEEVILDSDKSSSKRLITAGSDMKSIVDNEEVNVKLAKDTPPSAAKQSLNPFGDVDEEGDVSDKSKTKPPRPPPPNVYSENVENVRRIIPAPKINLNPFLSDDEDLCDEDAAAKPIPLPRGSKGGLTTLDPAPAPQSMQRTLAHGSATSLTHGSVTPQRRKKSHAPPPPGTVHAVRSDGEVSQDVSPYATPRPRKSRPAPPPPSLKDGEEDTETQQYSSTPFNNAAAVKDFTANLSPISVVSEGCGEWEKRKNNKDENNRTRQSQTSATLDLSPEFENPDNIIHANKSSNGKWKRKKGPAPLPVPPRRKIHVLPLTDIKLELEMIEVQQLGLEKQGVKLEQIIRDKCEGPDVAEDAPMPLEVEDLVLQLFELVNEKNQLLRRQAELNCLRKEQRLVEEQAELEYQIRCLEAQPERNKTDSDKAQAELLISRLVEVVGLRNEVVECLDMDRLREAEEDRSISSQLEIYTAKRDDITAEQSPVKLSKKEKKKEKEKKKLKKGKKCEADVDKDIDESETALKEKKKKKWFL